MITPLALQDALNDFLRERVASKLMLKSGVPQIVGGLLLPKSISVSTDRQAADKSKQSEYPFITTDIMKVEHIKNERTCIVTIGIMFGVHAPATYDENGMLIEDSSGYRDIWNMIEKTRQELFSQMTIDKKYRIKDDYFEAETPNEQPYPYWQGIAVTKWYVAYPEPEFTV